MMLALRKRPVSIEQIDAGHMATADPQRVKHYNKVLAEQLDRAVAALAPDSPKVHQ